MTTRLIAAEDGWWFLNGSRAARLPRDAVTDGCLVEEARAALAERHFFDAPARPFAVTVLTATSCNLVECRY